MRLSGILLRYIGRQYFFSFAAIFCVFMGLILMIDMVELLRRAASRPEIGFATIVKMSFLKLPHMGEKTFPFAILFGGMIAFWRLTRNHEFVVTRAAGVSVWQFLLPALTIAFVLGVVKISIWNPLASAALSRYEALEAVTLKGRQSLLALSETGLWLRQADKDGQSVVHSKYMVQEGQDVQLGNVIVFMYEGTDRFSGRIDAEFASLEDGFWHLTNAWRTAPETAPVFEKEYWLETDLTLSKIQDSFAPPETMSFWALPAFIKTLENAGFSAVRHRLHWHALLAAPLLACAMVLIAATFTLRHARRGGATVVFTIGVLAGFVLYFFSDLVFALGLSDSIPVTPAAWTPSGVMSLLGLATLLHLEDG